MREFDPKCYFYSPSAASAQTAKAIHDGLEHGDHVTSDQFKSGLVEVRAEIATELAALELRLIKWIVGTGIAVAAAGVAAVVGVLRLVGSAGSAGF